MKAPAGGFVVGTERLDRERHAPYSEDAMENPDATPNKKTKGGGLKVRADDARGTPKGVGQIKPAHGGQIGNPPHVVTEEMRIQVRTLAKVVTKRMAAVQLKISEKTIDRHYKTEWEEGSIEAIATIGGMMLQRALNGDRLAQMYILNTRGKEAYSRKIDVGEENENSSHIVVRGGLPERDHPSFNSEDE